MILGCKTILAKVVSYRTLIKEPRFQELLVDSVAIIFNFFLKYLQF